MDETNLNEQKNEEIGRLAYQARAENAFLVAQMRRAMQDATSSMMTRNTPEGLPAILPPEGISSSIAGEFTPGEVGPASSRRAAIGSMPSTMASASGDGNPPSYITATLPSPEVDPSRIATDFTALSRPSTKESPAIAGVSPVTGTERKPAESPLITTPPAPAQMATGAASEDSATQTNIAASYQDVTANIAASTEDLVGVLDSITAKFVTVGDTVGETTDKLKNLTESVKFTTASENAATGAGGTETSTPLFASPSPASHVSYANVSELRAQDPQLQAQDSLHDFRRAISGDVEGLSPEMGRVAATASWLQTTPREQWSDEQWDQAQAILSKTSYLRRVAAGEPPGLAIGGLSPPSYGSEQDVVQEDRLEEGKDTVLLKGIEPEHFTPPSGPTAIDEAVAEIPPTPPPTPPPPPAPKTKFSVRKPQFKETTESRRIFAEESAGDQMPNRDGDGEAGGRGAGDRGAGGGGGRGPGGGRSDSSWANWLAVQAIPGTVSYLAQRAAGTGAEAASPFIGEANASVLGGATQSVAGMAVGAGAIAAGAASGNMLVAGQGVAMLVKELITLPKQLSDWSKALLDSQFALKEWAGETAKIWAQVEVREILRGQASAAATSKTLEKNAMEWQQFYDAWRPTKDRATNWLNEEMANFAYQWRPFTDTEKTSIEKDFKEWQSGNVPYASRWVHDVAKFLGIPGSSEQERMFLEQQRKEHPEDFEKENGATYKIFEDWMRDWQDGKYMAPQSMRPAPVSL